MSEKMTNRNFLEAVADGTVTEEIKAFAVERIAALDKQNAARKAKPSKKAEENAPIKAAIVEILADAEKAMTAKEVAEAYGATTGEEISTQKASALLTQIVNAGDATKADNAKKQKVYTFAGEVAETEAE